MITQTLPGGWFGGRQIQFRLFHQNLDEFLTWEETAKLLFEVPARSRTSLTHLCLRVTSLKRLKRRQINLLLISGLMKCWASSASFSSSWIEAQEQPGLELGLA